MKTNYNNTSHITSKKLGVFLGMALVLCIVNLCSGTTLTTLGGGNPNVNPKYQGYKDGGTLTNALFHTPMGVALDESFGYLYVADRDNNAVRIVDLLLNDTETFAPTNMTKTPVGVAMDGEGDVFVLNRGGTNNISTNGYILEFDTYGDFIATNATKLTNAAGMAIDLLGNLYVTSHSNMVSRVAPNGTITTVAIITNTGTSLQGLVVKHNGLLAVCDSGRNGIYLMDPTTGLVTTNSGFNGTGDGTGLNNHGVLAANAKFNQPMGITEAGDGSLIITDTGNNRTKVINFAGVVTNLAGVSSNFWSGAFPGWFDGTVIVPDRITPNAQSRLPVGIVFSSSGTVYITEDYYHTIRKITGAGLPLPPPPPPQVPAPQIGWVSFPPPDGLSLFHSLTGASNSASAIFNNDATIVIVRGDDTSQTFFTVGATPILGSIPNPSQTNGSTPQIYPGDGSSPGAVVDLGIKLPDFTIKAVGTKNDGSPNSPIVQARIQYVAATPFINGNNAAQFTLNGATVGSTIVYTTDGSDPRNSPTSLTVFLNSTTNLTVNIASLNFSSNNFLFKAFARKQPGYQDSQVISNYFSSTGFIPNRITFGLTNGEPSSKFIARPGQFYYAPVTLQLQPGGETMYSMQFNIAVTNGLNTTSKVNGTNISFFPMLMSKVTPLEGLYYPPLAGQWFLPILPVASAVGGGTTNLVSTIFVDTNNNLNLLGVGWLYRTGFKYKLTDTNGNVFLDFDTAAQDLISYSIAHDTLLNKGNGVVAVGAYAFQIPTTANINDQYWIQLGSPSGTRDGVGAPGADVFIQAPVSNQVVTVGSPSYLVGDVAPFHWLNAGDFGEGILDNADVMQVFQCGIEGVDMPPQNSDLYFAMDSSGMLGTWDSTHNYYVNSGSMVPNVLQTMLDGNDLTINTNVFGDGILDVSDVYVTYRRSLDPSLVWFERYWTNNQFVAITTTNLAFNNNTPHVHVSQASIAGGQPSSQQPAVTFSAGDIIGSAGQTVQIPIMANVFGNYPLRVLGLNLTVYPLDGSPDITQAVQFTPATALGQPTIIGSKYAANYSAAWLNSSVAGLSGNTTIGTLTVTLPANATSSSAYAIHFNHASGSPNGIGILPSQKIAGILTTSVRTNSSYGDGIPDSWRLRWFGTVNNSLTVSNADACGDGINNWQKFIAGVDPTQPNSYPKLKSKSVPSGSTAAIHWPTVLGKKYAIERASNLFGNGWTAITTNTGTGTDMEFDDTNSGQVKFYRVRILP